MDNKKLFLDGNSAVAYAVKLASAEVISAYPITPQTKIVEKLAEYIANGELDAEYIKVESEHSAMSACLGAISTGVRTFTATSSHGLAYMQEMLHYISGGRFPVVMAVVNRGFAPPWNIWVDHQDTISTRDTGWMQVYVETGQEALDTILQAYKIAENPQVMTPIMVCLDAFILSHTSEIVESLDPQEVDKYLPPYQPQIIMDVDNPLTLCAGAGPDSYMEFRYAQQMAAIKAKKIIKEAAEEFKTRFQRSYGDLVEPYRLEGADIVLVTLGSMSGTVRVAVDELRQEGLMVGMLKVRYFRPFPGEEIQELRGRARVIGVLDRNISLGYEGALYTELKAALYHGEHRPLLKNYIVGLGGRDITVEEVKDIFRELSDLSGKEEYGQRIKFSGLRWSE